MLPHHPTHRAGIHGKSPCYLCRGSHLFPPTKPRILPLIQSSTLMNKDYFYKLWVMSLLGYVFVFQFMGEHQESGLYERLFFGYNVLNLGLFIAAIVILCLKWTYMLPAHRILSIIGMLINIGFIALLSHMWMGHLSAQNQLFLH